MLRDFKLIKPLSGRLTYVLTVINLVNMLSYLVFGSAMTALMLYQPMHKTIAGVPALIVLMSLVWTFAIFETYMVTRFTVMKLVKSIAYRDGLGGFIARRPPRYTRGRLFRFFTLVVHRKACVWAASYGHQLGRADRQLGEASA